MSAKSIFIRTWPVAAPAGLLLTAALAFTGCQSMPEPKPNAAVKPPVTTAHEDKIILREGDVLKITFPGSANMDTVQPIRRDGKLNLPLIGEVEAVSLTPDELQKKLVELYATQLSSKEITVQVQSSSFPVYVTGAVIKPGKVLSDHRLSLLEAIMEAGGPNYDTASLKAVRIDRIENGEMKHYIIDVKAILMGNETQPFYLKPNDIVYVPQRLLF